MARVDGTLPEGGSKKFGKLSLPGNDWAVMVLFDLNNVRGVAVAVAGHQGHGGPFQADLPAPVKTVKRLSTHPWPFPVKSDVAPHPAEPIRTAQRASSFVT